MQDYSSTTYPPETTGDKCLVHACTATRENGGTPYNCRFTFFTLRLGIMLHFLTYKDVVMRGSGLLRRLLDQIQPDGRIMTGQACDVSPIEVIIKKKLFKRYDWIPWTLSYLQFAHDHQAGKRLPNGLEVELAGDTGMSDLIDLHTVATFFQIDRLRQMAIAYGTAYLHSALRTHSLIFSEGSTGSAQFRQIAIPIQLEQMASAIERAEQVVPPVSLVWILGARYFLGMRQVLDGTDGGDRVKQHLSRLNSIGPFSAACLEVTLNIQPASLKGVFQAPGDWNLQCAICSCEGCSNVIFARDLVERKADELASGTIQKYALVNPFDGFRSVFCDYCRKRCGVPWSGRNKPCVPHE